ncbi:MAG: MATE family efflux transporter [Candidatus Kapaibacteriales bacterium]
MGLGFAIAFNVADTYFVGQLGADDLAALSACFPVIFAVIGVAMGLGTGASAVISRAIGKGDMDEVRRLTTDTIILAFFITVVMVLILWSAFDLVFELMDVPPKLMPLVREYMYIWMPGSVFLVPPMLGNFALRATGDTKTPSIIMGVAVGINFILDPLLIFGLWFVPGLGLAGAAIATLIGRAFTLFASWYFLSRKYEMICYTFSLREFFVSTRNVLQVGLPSAITSLVMPIGIFVVMGLVFEFGAEAGAAVGAASRVETLMFVPLMALGGVMSPFIGQNLGARNTDRIKDSLKTALLFSVGWSVFTYLVLYLFRHQIAPLFSDGNLTVEKFMVIYLAIQPIGIIFRGLTIVTTTTLNVLKRAWVSFFINLFQTIIIYLPLAYLFKEEYGFEGIFWASVLTSVLVSIAALIILKRESGRLETYMDTEKVHDARLDETLEEEPNKEKR